MRAAKRILIEVTVTIVLSGLAHAPALPDGSAGCAPMADSTCHCPPGTEYAIDPNGDREAGYTDQVQSIRIEYCRKHDRMGNWVRHGPCIFRGPNDERYEVGEYVDGKRDGVWQNWGPTQTSESRYDHGRYVQGFSGKIGYPDSVTIDFCNCRVQSGITYQTFGSSWWRLRGAKDDTCIVALDYEEEGGHPPTAIYHVPRSLGRITFPNATQRWTVLGPYFVGVEGKGGNLLLEGR